jgi:hypothetical protein
MPLLFLSKALHTLTVMSELGSQSFVGTRKTSTFLLSTIFIRVMKNIGMAFNLIINKFWKKKPDKLFHKTTSIANTL